MSNTERAVVFLVLQAILFSVSIAGAFLSHGHNNPAYLELFFVLPFLIGSVLCAFVAIRNTRLKHEPTRSELWRILIRFASIPMLLLAVWAVYHTLSYEIWISA